MFVVMLVQYVLLEQVPCPFVPTLEVRIYILVFE